MSAGLPGERLERWRDANWPPKALRQFGELPIYFGDHDSVTAFAETLGEALLGAADHIYDKCGGRAPRWMRVPKIVFGVERMNVAQSTAKASKRFSTLTALAAKCGQFPDAEVAKITQWLDSAEGAEVVAHKPFIDLRAYLFIKGKTEPERVRFYESGLVVAVEQGFAVQDHRQIVRRRRRDTLSDPLAKNDAGWAVFRA